MSTNEFSELIAMSCPDLKANPNMNGSSSTSGSNSQIHIYDEKRRLSVKQMTATELTAVRAAAALEIKNALTKISIPSQVASAPATPLTELHESNLKFNENRPSHLTASLPVTPTLAKSAVIPKTPEIVMDLAETNTDDEDLASSYQSSRSKSPGESKLDAKVKLLPTSPAPRERITSLPSILDDGMQESFLALSANADKTNSKMSVESNRSANQLTISANSVSHRNSDESNSPNKHANSLQLSSSSSSVSNLPIMHSIELMRQQRRNREGSRERRSDSFVNERCFLHDKNAVAERMHSSSISSIGSAAGGAALPALSLGKNTTSHHNSSNSSVISEASASATVVLPPTPPVYPLAKTSSAPNMEIRRSSLCALFPGPSPLVAPEPILHTDPKVEEVYTKEEIQDIVEDTLQREIPVGKQVHRTKTPPPVGVKLGVSLKKVTPPRTQITVKKNEGPMLGVVLRKVEKKQVPQKSILDDDKPLYHLSIVRSDGKDHKPSEHHTTSKPKPKPVPLQKSATSSAKPNPGGILTGPQVSSVKTAQPPSPQIPAKPQRPVPGVPITIQKIEGDKIIIIKKYIVPKNSKLPEHLLKVGVRILYLSRQSCICLKCPYSAVKW